MSTGTCAVKWFITITNNYIELVDSSVSWIVDRHNLMQELFIY